MGKAILTILILGLVLTGAWFAFSPSPVQPVETLDVATVEETKPVETPISQNNVLPPPADSASTSNPLSQIARLQKELEADPTNKEKYSELGMLLLAIPGRDAETLAAFREALKLDEENQAAVEALLTVHLRKNDTRSAEREIQDLMAKYPDSSAVVQTYAKSLLDRGQPAEAIPYLEKALARSDDKTFLTAELAQAYQQTRQWDKAIEKQQAVISERELALRRASENPQTAAVLKKELLASQLDMVEMHITSRPPNFREAESILSELQRSYPNETDVVTMSAFLQKRKKALN